jgi:hypothetical protein
MTMKTTCLTLSALLIGATLSAQVAYVLPSPTDANEEITLYIDVNQSTDGTSNNALKAILTDNPDEDVYLWSWQPAEPVVGNGSWNESNEELKLTKISDLLYSITFVPTEFYGIDGAQLFTNGISCLAKLKDGNAFGGEYDGEAKTEDISIDIVPRLCDRRICIFPEVRQEDDYLTITYDNNQEEIAGLQNMGDDDCYVYLVARITNFVFYEFVPSAQVTNTPELKLEPIPGQPGMFRTTIIPRDLFSLIPPDQKIKDLVFRILRPGFSYPGVPPQEIISILQCE